MQRLVTLVVILCPIFLVFVTASPAVASSPGRFSTASSDGKDSDTEVDFSKFKSNRKGDAPDGQVNKNRPPQKPFTPPRPGKKLQRLLQELEESDYGGYGTWGNFNMDHGRRVSRIWNKSNQQEAPPTEPPESWSSNEYPDYQKQQNSDSQWGGQYPTYYPDGSGMVPLQGPYALQDDDAEDFDHSRILSFSSVMKLGSVCVMGVFLAYLAVVPRDAPTQEYNFLFKRNILLLLSSLAGPILLMCFMYNGKELNINELVQCYHCGFTTGYLFSFGLEIILATITRVSSFWFFDRSIFEMLQDIPVIYIPWVWKDEGYRPRMLALFLSEFLLSCIAAPVVEESVKLILFKSCNYNIQKKDYQRKSLHSFLVYLTAISLGVKTADNARRILLYTKPQDTGKFFFAFARGIFPVHELCGALTAMGLVYRDVLGERVPFWKVIGPAVFLHSMANFRGMKPIFKWASCAPWTEMQLQAWNVPDHATAMQLLHKGIGGMVWFTILFRVFGYLMRSYYVVKKQLKLKSKFLHQPPQQ